MITLREALTRAAGQLAMHPDLQPTALQDAALLLTHLLQVSRVELVAHPERPITREVQASYQRLVERRLRFEPMQYITGVQEFFGLALQVTPAVLIPRPETELLVGAVLARLPADRTLQIADVGTGSGAVALALAAHLPMASIVGLDLSSEALNVAGENARAHNLHDRITFLQSDLLSAAVAGSRFHAIVSNPPYVKDADAATLHPQVREYEPHQALFSGASGLEIYMRLIPQALDRLTTGGLLALEIGHGQRTQIAMLLQDWNHVEFLEDLQQIPRVAVARRP